MPGKIRPGRILTSVFGDLASRTATRAREGARSRFRCDGCGRDFHGYRAMNAHHMAKHATRWTSDKARKAGRRMGKELDQARRHSRGWLEAAGLRDPRGNLTRKGRSRPEVRGRPALRDLRQLDRHDRDHQRADRHDQKAERARAKGNPARQADHHHRSANLRNQWPELRRPATRPPAPASDGTRPAQPVRPARVR